MRAQAPGRGGKGALGGLGRFVRPEPAVAPSGTMPEGLAQYIRVQPERAPGEHCELCGVLLASEHSHLVNVEDRGLLCSCRPCYLLFVHQGAAAGKKYRAVPDRYLRDSSFSIGEAQWEQLQIPVGLAFLFFNSSLDRICAFYPGPAGATESLLPLGAWDDLIGANPFLAELEPDVEAIMLRRQGSGYECYLVPIDACYELVGRVRLSWKGFDGGEEAWGSIDEFFAGVRDRSREVGGR